MQFSHIRMTWIFLKSYKFFFNLRKKCFKSFIEYTTYFFLLLFDAKIPGFEKNKFMIACMQSIKFFNHYPQHVHENAKFSFAIIDGLNKNVFAKKKKKGEGASWTSVQWPHACVYSF